MLPIHPPSHSFAPFFIHITLFPTLFFVFRFIILSTVHPIHLSFYTSSSILVQFFMCHLNATQCWRIRSISYDGTFRSIRFQPLPLSHCLDSLRCRLILFCPRRFLSFLLPFSIRFGSVRFGSVPVVVVRFLLLLSVGR